MPPPRFATAPDHLPDRDTLRSVSGLAFLQDIVAGARFQAPIARLMNIRLVEVEEGTAVFHGTPLFDHLNPSGGVHGGWYGTLLDSCMGCAVMTTLPRGRAYTTLEYKTNLIRAIRPDTPVIATGRISHSGRTTAVARGEIRCAETGHLHAEGNTTCLVMTLE